MYNHRSKNLRMRYYYNARGEKRYYTRQSEDIYECSKYTKDISNRKYTFHSTNTKVIETLVLETIREGCSYVKLNKDEFINVIQEESDHQNEIEYEVIKNV